MGIDGFDSTVLFSIQIQDMLKKALQNILVLSENALIQRRFSAEARKVLSADQPFFSSLLFSPIPNIASNSIAFLSDVSPALCCQQEQWLS
ncbi:MAG: hypothetical protein K6G15_07700 [Desulfovibrio sp.]|nr:hypothetical protein [Desulfovibrio sp.]